MHLRQQLHDLAERFAASGVQEASLKAELLVSHVLDCRRLELHVRGAEDLGEPRLRSLTGLAARVCRGEPVQYVLGETDFMGHAFQVDPRALIPRPETEVLVERVLARSELWNLERPAVADAGTGSGCIVVSLALARAHGAFLATDISEEALALARENARALGVGDRIRFVKADGLGHAAPGTLDAVVANPPYVDSKSWAVLPREIRDFEPRAALDGGDDGLRVISRLVPQAFGALKSGGSLFLEIGEDQAVRVQELMKTAGFGENRVWKDLAGRDRIAWGRKP